MSIRKRFAQIGIGVRLAVLTTVTILVAIAVFVVISTMVQRRQAIDLVKLHTDNLSHSIEQILRFSMEENRREEIRLAIQRLSQSDDIVDVSLTNHQGKVVYASTDSLIGRQVKTSDYKCFGCHFSDSEEPLPKLRVNHRFQHQPEHEIARSIMPIYSESSCFTCHTHKAGENVFGIIEISISTQYIQEALKNSHLKLILYSFVIAVVVLIILMYFVRLWISKPVNELIEGTRKVAGGDLDHIVTVDVAELGELSTAFNAMQSRLKSSRQQLIMSEKLASLGKLAAMVAHEINNPLTGTLTFTEALIEDADEEDERLKDYEVIKRETLRCRKIVRNLLDYTRQDKPELESTNINHIIQRTVDMLNRQALFSNIEFILTLPESLPLLLVDPGQIQQVLVNLIINAAEAMPDGGTIRAATRFIEDRSEVQISVQDTGQGIPESVLSRIFEPLFSTKGGKSNGLGLSVTWGIIRQHHGKIDVSSIIDKGTTFQVYLPVNKQTVQT